MNHAAVATHHPLATEAARQMLGAGGNAADAAVAAMATLCVVVPGSVGFGGYGGSMVVYEAARRRVVALDFDSRAPLEFRDELFADRPANKSNLGYLAVGVPAVVAGLAAALRQFGTKNWKDVTYFATELAENGFEVDAHNRGVLEEWHAHADDISRRAHFADSSIPAIGDRWVQKDLAKLLRQLAADGPESFYRGEVAQRIVTQVREHGGILSMEDLATYRPSVVEPIKLDYRGSTIYTPPPPSGGLTTLQMLKTLEHFDLAAMERWSAPYLHLVAEVSKRCWGDRAHLGDPDFVKIPYDELLASSLASSRAADVRRNDIKTGIEARIDDFPHTCNVSIVDPAGNLVSLTATQGGQFGSGVVIEGLGLVLGHGMSRFDYKPDHPNRPAPGKRPYHNMVPMVILKDGRPLATLGMPGGTRIVTATAQLVVSLIDFKATPQETVNAPRVHSEGREPLVISDITPPQVAAELQSMGHTLEFGQHLLGVPRHVGGPANAILIDADGRPTAAASAGPDAAYDE